MIVRGRSKQADNVDQCLTIFLEQKSYDLTLSAYIVKSNFSYLEPINPEK